MLYVIFKLIAGAFFSWSLQIPVSIYYRVVLTLRRTDSVRSRAIWEMAIFPLAAAHRLARHVDKSIKGFTMTIEKQDPVFKVYTF